jgi:predicted Zn-dependent peptidase
LLLVVAGDFKAAQLRAQLEKALDGWTSPAPGLPDIEPAPRVAGGQVLLIDKPGATQTYFWIGNVGVRRSDPDAVAIELVNTLFGGRFTSMLNSALRIESGLTYGARSRIDEPTQPGTVAMVSYTATESTVEAVNMALAQLRKLHEQGFSESQLESGKTYRQGLFPMGFETAKDLASQLMTLKFYGLADNTVNDYARDMAKVSLEKSRAVINRVYPPEQDLVFVFIGDSERIGQQVTAYGKVTHMSITDPDWFAPRTD